MTDFRHLDAINMRIARETGRLASATTDSERAYRRREIAAAEKELAAEYRYLGIDLGPLVTMTDEELLAELGA